MKYFVETGLIHAKDGRLAIPFFAIFHNILNWQNLLGWAVLNACLLAAGLLPFWYSVRRLFNQAVAWGAVALLSVLPFYWHEALHLNYYSLALPLLFATFAAFLHVYPRSFLSAAIISGLLFGLTIAAKDVFILFFPWLVFAYVWAHRSRWKPAVLEASIFCILAGLVYMVPMVPQAIQTDASLTEKLQILLPGAPYDPANVEFYPDPYTAHYDSEWYDQKILKEKQVDTSVLEQMKGRNRMLTLGLGDGGVLSRLSVGSWLFLNTVPKFFLQSTLGGGVLWLFYVAGFAVLFRTRRQFFWYGIGLVLSTEFIIRFGLYYQRIHIMNYGWLFAIAAAVGLNALLPSAGQALKIRRSTIVCALVVLLGLQLVQTNRQIFAEEYARSIVPHRLAVAEAMHDLPPNAVVAAPITQLSLFSDTETVYFQQSTIDRLLARGDIEDAFAVYRVSHIFGYTASSTAKMRAQMPRIRAISSVEPKLLHVTPWMNYILHLIR